MDQKFMSFIASKLSLINIEFCLSARVGHVVAVTIGLMTFLASGACTDP